MSGSFHICQKVVCVDDTDIDDAGTNTGFRYLQRGKTYTVSRTYVLSSGPGVNLLEIDRPYSYEGFRTERFRLAIAYEEDISGFAGALESKDKFSRARETPERRLLRPRKAASRAPRESGASKSGSLVVSPGARGGL
jgi:hypothetical protein